MKPGPSEVVAYLLSRMRAKDLVAAALSNLEWSLVDLGHWNERAVASGLDSLGHPIDSYERLLGVPVSARSIEGDRSREIRARLGPWPSIDFVAYANTAGMTTQLRFEPRDVLPAPQLVPWHFVEDQLATRPENVEIADEWYPRLDIRLRTTVAGLYLRFDFGLLQSVEPDDSKAEVEQ